MCHPIYCGMRLPLVIGGPDPQIPGPLVRSGPAPLSFQMRLAEHIGQSCFQLASYSLATQSLQAAAAVIRSLSNNTVQTKLACPLA